MRDARQGRCAMQGKVDAPCKARYKRHARQGRYVMQGSADAHCKARQISDARLGRYSRQVRRYSRARQG
jgi:hypothetical protein